MYNYEKRKKRIQGERRMQKDINEGAASLTKEGRSFHSLPPQHHFFPSSVSVSASALTPSPLSLAVIWFVLLLASSSSSSSSHCPLDSLPSPPRVTLYFALGFIVAKAEEEQEKNNLFCLCCCVIFCCFLLLLVTTTQPSQAANIFLWQKKFPSLEDETTLSSSF